MTNTGPRPQDRVISTPGLRVYYRPANRAGDLRPGSTHKAMDKFLMSDDVQRVADEAAKDIADAARDLAVAEGSVNSGTYARSFVVLKDVTPIVADGNPRRTAAVINDDRAAAPLEFGNSRVRARRFLGRAGAPYHTPKGIA